MATSFEKSDPDGLEPPGASRDPAAVSSAAAASSTGPSSPNKHLTRLVRFSILQARRSSQAAKGNNKEGSNMPPSPTMAAAGEQPSVTVTSPSSKTTNNAKTASSPRTSPSKYPFSFGNLSSGDKERPSTEVQYRDEYHDAPGQVVGGGGVPGTVGGVVDVPTDPPIIEDLSASLTLSAGEERSDFSREEDDDGTNPDDDHEDMDLLLAPDSGSNVADIMMNQSSSNEQYGSAEMYSSSGNYDDDDDGSHSSNSGISSSSSDSIMRRVEQEIANARQASNDAQARLAYFTQKQKELAPVMTDSYSFDFENHLGTSGDNLLHHNDQQQQQQQHRGQQQHPHRHHQEDNFNNAMGVIGKEFDNSPAAGGTNSNDVGEKVDIEVVLAPSQNQNNNAGPNNQPPPSSSQGYNNKPNIPSPRRSPTNTRQSPRAPPPQQAQQGQRFGGYKSPSPRQYRSEDDSIDIDEAVIQAVFSEKSIESLPIRESFPQDVFSEPSMDSLPTQQPDSYSLQDSKYSDVPSFIASPTGSQQHNKKPNMPPLVSGTVGSPQQRHLQGNLSVDVTSPLTAEPSVTSPTNSDYLPSPGTRRLSSKLLPSTPRDPGTPSYRERLENKLKILGSRYPVTSPTTTRSNTTLNSKRDYSVGTYYKAPGDDEPQRETRSKRDSEEKDKAAQPSKEEEEEEEAEEKPSAPVPTPVSATNVETASYGESYDGLESRIKHLLARTLHPMPPPTPAATQKPTGGDQEAIYQSSPSAELKAIRKLLEQGVAAATAAEERKRDQEEERAAATTHTNAKVEPAEAEKAKKADDLSFPDLDGAPQESQEVTTSGTVEEDNQVNSSKASTTRESPMTDDGGIQLHLRSAGPVRAVMNSAGETKKEPEPSVTCSTSEEILEQLDSLSQSSAFKSKSRTGTSSNGKAASRSASPKSIPEESKENVDEPAKRKTRVPLDKQEAAPGSAGGEEMSPKADNGPKNKGSSETRSVHPVLGDTNNEDSSGEEDMESSFIGNMISGNISNAVESDLARPSGDRDQSTSQPSVKHDQAQNRQATEAQNEPRSKATLGQQEEASQNGSISSKKTPSVLNAALCRPSSTEVRERKNNEKKRRQKPPTPETPGTEDEKSLSTNAPVNASSSQVSENTAEGFGSTEPSAEESGKVSGQCVDAPEGPDSAAGSDQCNEDTTHANQPSSKQNTEFELQGKLPNSAPSNHDPSQDLSNEKAMQTCIVDPTQKSQNEGLPPKPNANPSRKTVSLQEPERDGNGKVLSIVTQPSTSRQDRKIRFRDPYPTPKPCRKPRSTEEIQRDYSCQPTNADKKTKWKEPKGDLKRLLVAALDSSLSRRSNACGALKVISKVEKNKLVLVRTTGFLEALVFVATDDVSSEEPDAKEDARARAISCIYNVSHVKDNRLLVCTHPGLLECLVQTINEDYGEARTEACGVLAQLAKNSMCREVMVGVEELLPTLASVLKGTMDPQEKMIDDILSEDVTEDIPSSYSEMSSVLSEEHIPFPKTSGSSTKNRVRPHCSIRKQKSEMHDQYYELAKLSSCAALIHLSKQCSILDHFCSNQIVLESIVEVAGDSESKLHGKCLEMLCNISRLPGNTTAMTRFPGMVETLLSSCSSANGQDRVWALRTLQNMTSDAASKSTLATSTLLTLLINCVTSRNVDEQHAAMATLLNLSTDPSAVVPITSTKNVLATLVYLAHNAESTSEIRLMACNALATVGLWLQTVSGFGSIPEETRRVLLPSHKTTGWEIWD